MVRVEMVSEGRCDTIFMNDFPGFRINTRSLLYMAGLQYLVFVNSLPITSYKRAHPSSTYLHSSSFLQIFHEHELHAMYVVYLTNIRSWVSLIIIRTDSTSAFRNLILFLIFILILFIHGPSTLDK